MSILNAKLPHRLIPTVRVKALCLSVLVAVFVMMLVVKAHALTTMGAIPCGKWVKNDSLAGIAAAAQSEWLTGYLSGLAVGTAKNILINEDHDSLQLWVTNYCKANPLNDTSNAGNELFLELIRKKA